MPHRMLSSTARVSLLVLAVGVPCIAPAAAGTPDGYTAEMKVTDKGEAVTSAVAYADAGKPFAMGITSSARYGGEEGSLVKSGFRFELTPVPTADGMNIELRMDRDEIVDARTGALRQEAAVIHGSARRTDEGWVYETNWLPGGKSLRVTLNGTSRPD